MKHIEIEHHPALATQVEKALANGLDEALGIHESTLSK